jgi:AcrR family transcriptional regulator
MVVNLPNRGIAQMGAVPTIEVDGEGTPALRADAARNRERIVAAAQEVFAEWGLNAALEKIARRAGVGIATLYRRFPTRANLIAASFERKMADYVAATEHALDDPDPWAGFSWLVHKLCSMQASDAGLKDLFTMRLPSGSAVVEMRDRALSNQEKLIERAKQQGSLRPEFMPADVPMILFANAGIVTATRDSAPDTWRRFTEYMIIAFRADSFPSAPSSS